MLGAFSVVGIGDRAVLVVRMGSGLGDAGISVNVGYRSLGRLEAGFEREEEPIFVHGFISIGSNGGDRLGGGVVHLGTNK